MIDNYHIRLHQYLQLLILEVSLLELFVKYINRHLVHLQKNNRLLPHFAEFQNPVIPKIPLVSCP